MDRLKSVSVGKHQDGRAVQGFEAWAKLEGAVAKGRHLRLMSTRFEDMLHDGLVTMQLTSDKEKAHRLFQQAMTLEPKNYLPFLFGAPVSVDPIDSLTEALEIQPDSLKAWVLLGEECARRGKIIEAFQSFESALKVYPDYEIAYLRAADLLTKLGKKVQADSLFKKAKELEMHHP
jgi:tetratricopeptide (TPR) repeat protein